MNLIISSAIIPAEWKTAIITPIYNNLVTNTQSSFRPQHSTLTATLNVTE